MIESLFFIIGSYILVFISKSTLANTRSHGFSRLLAWEAILALFVLNAKYWWLHPFSPQQLISWTLLSLSLVYLFSSLYLLLAKGHISSDRKDNSLFKLEKTTVLVTSGIYRYIRHPMYGSLLFLAWGIFAKQTSFLSLLLTLLSTGFLLLTAKREEIECVQYFGEAYKDYMNKTKLFLPFLL